MYQLENVIKTIGETKTVAKLCPKKKKKTIPNKYYLLKQFISLKMNPSDYLEENLNRCTKLNQDSANCDAKLLKDQLNVVLLNFINDRHRDLKNALQYGRGDEITTDIIISALRNRILELESKAKDNHSGGILIAKNKNNGKSNYHFENTIEIKEKGVIRINPRTKQKTRNVTNVKNWDIS